MIETTMPETYDETASVMRVLLDQLHATEADRDELAAQVNSMQYELDAVTAIKAERDAWKQAHDEQVAKLIEIANERDALKDAARLALDALSEYGNPYNWDEDFHGIRRKWQEPKSNTPSAYNGFELAQPAIAALKAVL